MTFAQPSCNKKQVKVCSMVEGWSVFTEWGKVGREDHQVDGLGKRGYVEGRFE